MTPAPSQELLPSEGLPSLAAVLHRAASSRLARATAAGSISLAVLLVACVPANAPATAETLVNPFIGTQNFGNTFPGAALPFGMVQVSPDNGGQAGYDYDHTRIDGFSHTHLSGVGCGALGEVPRDADDGRGQLRPTRRATARTPPRHRAGAPRLLPASTSPSTASAPS